MSKIMKLLSNNFPTLIAEMIGNIAATTVITVVDAKVEYYITDPEGINSGCGYFIDHPEDTEKKNTPRTIIKRVLVDRSIIKLKK